MAAFLKGHAYLLAAGRGRRAGGPKAWNRHQGRVLLEHHVDFLTATFDPRSVSVSIQQQWLERCRALHADVHWVPTDPEQSALSSLLSLLQAVPLTEWGFVLHVDMPLWNRALFEELARAAQGADDTVDAVMPTYDGRGGHPVVLSPRAADALARLDAQRDRLDHWLRGREVLRVAVPDAAIHENWNDPGSPGSSQRA